jgi:hypothetical protein
MTPHYPHLFLDPCCNSDISSFAERSIKTKMIQKYIQNDLRHKRSGALVVNSQKYNIKRHQKWERNVWIK